MLIIPPQRRACNPLGAAAIDLKPPVMNPGAVDERGDKT